MTKAWHLVHGWFGFRVNRDEPSGHSEMILGLDTFPCWYTDVPGHARDGLIVTRRAWHVLQDVLGDWVAWHELPQSVGSLVVITAKHTLPTDRWIATYSEEMKTFYDDPEDEGPFLDGFVASVEFLDRDLPPIFVLDTRERPLFVTQEVVDLVMSYGLVGFRLYDASALNDDRAAQWWARDEVAPYERVPPIEEVPGPLAQFAKEQTDLDEDALVGEFPWEIFTTPGGCTTHRQVVARAVMIERDILNGGAFQAAVNWPTFALAEHAKACERMGYPPPVTAAYQAIATYAATDPGQFGYHQPSLDTGSILDEIVATRFARAAYVKEQP